MEIQRNDVRLRVWGDLACFTRPEMKVERVSYDVMTPSAARNILQCIAWKPSFDWIITQIDVLKPVLWTSVRRNEVGEVISVSNVTSAMKKGAGTLGMYVEENRQQRASLLLRDVEYIIHARLTLTGRASKDESETKFLEIFRRRASKGQCFLQPYLGCREFAAYFELVENGSTISTVSDSRDLGWMIYDLCYTGREITPTFFHAALNHGVVQVPSPYSEEIRA